MRCIPPERHHEAQKKTDICDPSDSRFSRFSRGFACRNLSVEGSRMTCNVRVVCWERLRNLEFRFLGPNFWAKGGAVLSCWCEGNDDESRFGELMNLVPWIVYRGSISHSLPMEAASFCRLSEAKLRGHTKHRTTVAPSTSWLIRRGT